MFITSKVERGVNDHGAAAGESHTSHIGCLIAPCQIQITQLIKSNWEDAMAFLGQ